MILAPPKMGERWHGGRIHYGTSEQPFSEAVEHFFQRLVFMRDQLLALEATIDSCDALSRSEVETFGGYIRRSFGSLTTFNLLFAEKEDYFSSKRH